MMKIYFQIRHKEKKDKGIKEERIKGRK